MGRFLHHTNCPNCGSSDALAVYEAGDVYCFSCGYYKSSKVSPYVFKELEHKETSNSLPDDVTKDYNYDAVQWVSKYDITVADLLSCNNPIYYSPARNQLIFSWNDDTGKTIAWQARNLNKDTPKSKRYFTKGNVNDLLPIYHHSVSSSGATSSMSSYPINRQLVLVEDCLSAIKVSKVNPQEGLYKGQGYDSMPALGSNLTNKKLSRLRPFYDVLAVFLDPDMFHKAVDIANRAQMLGFSSSVVTARCDPKELSYADLRSLLL